MRQERNRHYRGHHYPHILEIGASDVEGNNHQGKADGENSENDGKVRKVSVYLHRNSSVFCYGGNFRIQLEFATLTKFSWSLLSEYSASGLARGSQHG